MKMFAYEGAKVFPIAVPLTCKYLWLLNVKSFCLRLIVRSLRISDEGLEGSGYVVKDSLMASIPSSISMFV